MKKTTCTNLEDILNGYPPATVMTLVDENGNTHYQNIIIPVNDDGDVDRAALRDVVFSVMMQLHQGRQGINYPQNITIPMDANGEIDRDALRSLNRTLAPLPLVPAQP